VPLLRAAPVRGGRRPRIPRGAGADGGGVDATGGAPAPPGLPMHPGPLRLSPLDSTGFLSRLPGVRGDADPRGRCGVSPRVAPGSQRMFTGIIEEVGLIREVRPQDGGLRLRIEAPGVTAGARAGDSIAVDGVCLTVVALEPDGFSVDVIGTTLSRTTLGSFAPGRRVNLERALALGDRLGGHLVQGHVDGVGEVLRVVRDGEHVLMDVRLDPTVADVSILHGSIVINGVSLTINALPGPDVAQVALIPYTWQHTNLSDLKPGDGVNLEGDMIGKFVTNYLRRAGFAAAPAK